MVADAKFYTSKTGLYTPAEAAFYARLHPGTLNRWLFGGRGGRPVFTPQLGDANERVVSFLDFVQALAIRAIRAAHHIHLDKIRAAVETAERDYKIKYPLARKHTTYLAGRELLIVPQPDQNPVQISGNAKGQVQLRPVLELFMLDVGFDAENLARSYVAFRDPGGREVVMDPTVRFGEPLIRGCGYTPGILAEAVETEGGIEEAARAYGVEVADVLAATRYFDHLKGVMAA